jgi:transcriptional regulator with GAF, ATPase, and Fis domain
MPVIYSDLLFCLTFVIVLLITFKVRQSIFKMDKSTHRKILTGLSFFVGFSVLQLLGHQNLLEGIPFIEESAGRKLVEAVGIVAGLIFLLAGIGAWLPSLGRVRRESQSINKRYFCMKMISQTLGQGKDLDRGYELVMNYLSTYLGIPRCATFKYSTRKDMLTLSSAFGFSEKHPPGLRRLAIKDTELKTQLHSHRTITSTHDIDALNGGRQPDIIVPISYQKRLFGALFLWTEGVIKIDSDFLDFISVTGEMVGKHTASYVLTASKEYHRTQQDSYERLNKICSQIPTVQELMPHLFPIIKELTDTEFLSIAMLDNSGENMINYTIGSSGRMLLEKGISRQTRGTEIWTIFNDGQPILRPKINAESINAEEDGLFLSCGMRSKLACPVMVGKKTVAIITLGHPQTGHFTRMHLRRIAKLTNMLAGIIQREQLGKSLEIKEDYMLRLQLMERELLGNTSVQGFFDDACDLLTKRMGCTMARISLLNNDRTNLISQACKSIRNTQHDLNESTNIPMPLLPWHRMTIDAKKLMLINQEDKDSRMLPQESTSILLPDIKSAILVPITLNGDIGGVISVGEARNWNRRSFNATDLIFAKDIAAKCSVALRLKQLEQKAERSQEQMISAPVYDDDKTGDMRMQLKSPLTSIIGAVELLKAKGLTDQFSEKYHDLILRSADRIKDMTDDKKSVKLAYNEIEPERVIG